MSPGLREDHVRLTESRPAWVLISRDERNRQGVPTDEQERASQRGTSLFIPGLFDLCGNWNTRKEHRYDPSLSYCQCKLTFFSFFTAWLSFGTVYPRLQKLSISSLKQSSHWKMEKCWSQACLTVFKSCVLIWDRFGGLQRAPIPLHILPLQREGRVCLTGKLLSTPALPRPQGAWSTLPKS